MRKLDFMTWNTNKRILISGIAVLTLLFISNYNSIFDSKLDANGDNYHYYILGKSLNEGNGYRSSYTPTNQLHNHYPPGYPFLISVMMVFSDSFDFIKTMNGVFLLSSILLLCLIYYNFTKIKRPFVYVFIGIFCLLNYNLLKYSTIMMSEISFTFFSIASLFLFFLMEKEEKRRRKYLYLFLLITTVSLTFYIRTTGVIMFLTFFFYYISQKQWKKSLVVVGLSILIIAPWQIRSSVYGLKSSYQGQLLAKNPYNRAEGAANFGDFLERFATNVNRYISKEIPNGVFPFLKVNYNQPEESDVSQPVAGVLTLIFAFLGLFFIEKKLGIMLFLYIAGTFTVLLLWPVSWYGTRFFLPLVPLFLFLIFVGFFELVVFALQKLKINSQLIPYTIFILISLVFFKNFSPAINDLKKVASAPNPPGLNDFIKIAEYAKVNLPSDAVVANRKGQIFYVHSGKKALRYPDNPVTEEVLEFFDEKNITHVIVDRLGYSSTGRFLVPVINKHRDRFTLIREVGNPSTLLFKYNNGKS